MKGMRTGLRHRLRRSLRQVEEQHVQLRRIAGELDRALGAGDVDGASGWLHHFVDALSAHFDLEEEVLFPALRGLDVSISEELRRLELDHGEFLGLARALAVATDLETAVCVQRVGSLRIGLAEHERREEKLIGLALESSAGR